VSSSFGRASDQAAHSVKTGQWPHASAAAARSAGWPEVQNERWAGDSRVHGPRLKSGAGGSSVILGCRPAVPQVPQYRRVRLAGL
jgi:hypothetical protein